MDESLAIALLTNGKIPPSVNLFVDKRFETEFLELTRLYLLSYLHTDQTTYEEYQRLFYGEGRYEIPYRNNYIRKVITYVHVMAGLIWLTSGGSKPCHFDENLCSTTMKAVFKGEVLPIDYDTVAEAKVLMNQPIGSRIDTIKTIVKYRTQAGRDKINSGRVLSTIR
jgi:hypothetical protein